MEKENAFTGTKHIILHYLYVQSIIQMNFILLLLVVEEFIVYLFQIYFASVPNLNTDC